VKSPYTPDQAVAVAMFNAGIRAKNYDEKTSLPGIPTDEAKQVLKNLTSMGWVLSERVS